MTTLSSVLDGSLYLYVLQYIIAQHCPQWLFIVAFDTTLPNSTLSYDKSEWTGHSWVTNEDQQVNWCQGKKPWQHKLILEDRSMDNLLLILTQQWLGIIRWTWWTQKMCQMRWKIEQHHWASSQIKQHLECPEAQFWYIFVRVMSADISWKAQCSY